MNCRSLAVLFLLLSLHGTSQPLLRKVLFLGNSYTYVNDLPLLTAALAQASGDSLFTGSHTPGGYTLGWQPAAHRYDPVSLSAIQAGDWDFVVLQEQSQTPSIGRLRDSCMMPAARVLHDSVKASNPCSRPLFYLTWGRRYGGMQCFTPAYCSYPFASFGQMQDTVTRAYKMVADSLQDWIAPVGEAWRLVIDGTGMVLHSSDDSHPNIKGSYLAACVFYDVIFSKPVSGNAFTAGIPADTALLLQKAADSVVFGFPDLWNIGNDLPVAAMTLRLSADTLYTTNLSALAGEWRWDFGDGTTSGDFEPVHVYTAPGNYTVVLKACNDCFCDADSTDVTVLFTGRDEIEHEPVMQQPGSDNIRIGNIDGDAVFRMSDVTGRVVMERRVTRGSLLPLPGSKGIFFWRLESSDGKTATGKIVFR